MRIAMTSPILARRRRFDRSWQPCSRLEELLGRELAGDCGAAILSEANGIGSAQLRRGGSLQLLRSSDSRWISSGDGRVRRLPPDGWRSEAGVFAPATNLCLQSEALATSPWAGQNGVTRVLDGGVSGPLPNVYRISDPGSSGTGALSQAIGSITDGQPHTAGLFIKAGTSVSFSLAIRDITAGLFKALANFTVTGGRITVQSVVIGTCRVDSVPQSNWYWVTVQAPSLTAANTNWVLLYPTQFSVAVSGDLYATGGSVQQGPLALPYIGTTAAASSRSADQVDLSAGCLKPAFTAGLVTRILDHTGTPSLLTLPGTAGNNNRVEILVSASSGLNVTMYDSLGVAKTWAQNAAPVDREVARYIVTNDNAGTVRAWKNGNALSLTASGAGSGMRDGVGATVQIGRKDMGNFLQGEMRSGLLFTRALTDAEVARVQGALQRLDR